MNSLAPHAFPAKNGSDDVMISDRYQEIKFRVFDVTLEYLERQGITGEAMQHSALLDEIARSISIVLGARGLAPVANAPS
jgi:pilus assembly protein CpaF